MLLLQFRQRLVRLLPDFTLLRRFVLIGMLVTFAAASLMAYTVSRYIIAQELDHIAKRAASTADMLITPQVNATHFNSPTPTSVQEWKTRLTTAIHGTNIVRVKVFSSDGTVVYSDDSAIIGKRYETKTLRTALKGHIAQEVGKPKKVDNAGEQQYQQLFEVYVPVREPSSGKIIGVFEVYRAFEPIRTKLTQVQWMTWSGFIVTFGLLFASLYALVRSASTRLEYMAYHDALTGLANRYHLIDRIEHALARSRRRDEQLSLLYFDLARFKAINDSYGHKMGDAVLKQVASRLRDLVRPGDTVARLGGDEFVMLLNKTTSGQQATDAAIRIIKALEAPFTIHKQQVHLTTRIGIAQFPQDANSSEDLLIRADAAMYRAKADGTRYEFYKPHMIRYTREQLQFEENLRLALLNEELVLHYQPVMNLHSGRLIGAEALVRWIDPQRGMIPPMSFIPLAEENGMILDIDRYVTVQALRQLALWQADGSDLTMAVNLSPQSFADSTFTPWLAEEIGKAGVPASSLILEITERVLMDAQAGRQRLTDLAALGVQIALDDFGTGYSSLMYLQDLPIKQLKIDKHFIQGIGTLTNSAAIVKTIISLAHNMGIESLAEGIEAQKHYEWLSKEGCDTGQGFLLGRPVCAAEFAEVIEKYLARAEDEVHAQEELTGQ